MLEWSSDQCPGDEVENSTTISGTVTNFTISDLRSDTSYSITVTASNAAGNSTSNVLMMNTPIVGKVCVANVIKAAIAPHTQMKRWSHHNSHT